ncbi:hypothetical protein ACOKFD_03215 [Flagellimonas sp. S174]|uniref:hypothetical protein n=1 Tax=Flagellimonas sp. S174 TaxID=3410790 RepID=UPI003BF5423F
MRKACFLTFLLIPTLSCQHKNTQKDKIESTVTNDSIMIDIIHEEKVTLDEIEDEIIEDDMDFMPPVEEQSYYGIEIGNPIKDYQLPSETLKTGEGEFQVYYMLYNRDTLGYVYGEDLVESIHIWDGSGATMEGVRVGTTFWRNQGFVSFT